MGPGENGWKKHKKCIYSKIGKQIWLKLKICTTLYAWRLYPARGKWLFPQHLPGSSNGVPDIPGKFSLPLIVFRDCKDGLLAAEGEGGLCAWVAKEGFSSFFNVTLVYLLHGFRISRDQILCDRSCQPLYQESNSRGSFLCMSMSPWVFWRWVILTKRVFSHVSLIWCLHESFESGSSSSR